MHLSLEALRSLVTASEVKSFTRAGERMGLTQSAVSMQIKRLEELTGQRLFQRQSRRVLLTPEGRTLLDYARRILELHDQALAQLSTSEQEGVIRLGAPEDYATLYLPAILAEFAKTHPRVRVDMFCEPSSDLRQALADGKLDLTLLTAQEIGQIVHREQVVWTASKKHCAWQEEPLPLAVFHHGCYYRAWAIQALDDLGRDYRIAYTSPSIAGIMAAVSMGLAVSPLGRNLVGPELRILGPEQGFPLLPTANITLLRSESGDFAPLDDLARRIMKGFVVDGQEVLAGPDQ